MLKLMQIYVFKYFALVVRLQFTAGCARLCVCMYECVRVRLRAFLIMIILGVGQISLILLLLFRHANVCFLCSLAFFCQILKILKIYTAFFEICTSSSS